MSRHVVDHVGDLVLVPEAKPDEGLIVWWLGVLSRVGGNTRADGGSYVRLGEKRKRKIEPGGRREAGMAGLRPFVPAAWLEEGWQERLCKKIVTTTDPFLAFKTMYASVEPVTKEKHRLKEAA